MADEANGPGDVAVDLILAANDNDAPRVREILLAYPCLANFRTSQLNLPGKDTTPLHAAAFRGHMAIVQNLVESGADATARDADGDTPFNSAVLGRSWDVAHYLASIGQPSEETQRDQRCAWAYSKHVEEASRPGPPSAKTGCFVATAVYGSPMAPEVQVLRDFRDEVLCRTELGRALIWLYVRIGPLGARALERRPGLKPFVRRAILSPLCRWAAAKRSRCGNR